MSGRHGRATPSSTSGRFGRSQPLRSAVMAAQPLRAAVPGRATRSGWLSLFAQTLTLPAHTRQITPLVARSPPPQSAGARGEGASIPLARHACTHAVPVSLSLFPSLSPSRGSGTRCRLNVSPSCPVTNIPPRRWVGLEWSPAHTVERAWGTGVHTRSAHIHYFSSSSCARTNMSKSHALKEVSQVSQIIPTRATDSSGCVTAARSYK